MYAIETKNLVKEFDNVKAVNLLNLKIPKKCVYGFLGPNGAGKTTTIKMLVGLSKPTSGEILIMGNELNYGKSNNEYIGYLPDVPAYYNWMRPHELLKFLGQLYGIDNETLDERIAYLMELVGLEGVNKKIGYFSRGMKQRIGIAQALINKPDIVFLDEPTSALDPIGRKEILDLIFKLRDETTVVFSTHILSDVEKVCDRVAIINNGQMILEDNIKNLKENFTINTIVVQLNNSEQANTLTNLLGQSSLVHSIERVEDSTLHLNVGNLEKAQIEVPKIIAQSNIPLIKFAIKDVGLEDIFMKVVKDN